MGGTNTHLAELATRGPWHLFHSVADMTIVIRAFAGAANAACQQECSADVLGTKHPPATPQTKDSKSMIDLFRQHVSAEPEEEEDVQTWLSAVADRGDTFELQWYMLFVLYTSSRFRTQLCLGSPKTVCDRMLINFVQYLDQHLFGVPPSKTAKDALQQTILTPVELVPRFLSDLHMAYFAGDQETESEHG
jgi:hypothetical protein